MSIDTLPYVRALEAAGVDRRVAEAQAEALAHILAELPTKADLAPLATRSEISELRTEMGQLRAEVGGLRVDVAEIKGAMRNLPTTFHMVFMQSAFVLAVFAAAFVLLRMAH
jgi:hypothetical protein